MCDDADDIILADAQAMCCWQFSEYLSIIRCNDVYACSGRSCALFSAAFNAALMRGTHDRS